MFKRIAGLSFIRTVEMIESPYKLMDRRSGLSDHIVKIGKNEIGAGNPFIIGGPCTIDPEQPNLYLETAHALKESGVQALRGVYGSLERTPIPIRAIVNLWKSFFKRVKRLDYR